MTNIVTVALPYEKFEEVVESKIIKPRYIQQVLNTFVEGINLKEKQLHTPSFLERVKGATPVHYTIRSLYKTLDTSPQEDWRDMENYWDLEEGSLYSYSYLYQLKNDLYTMHNILRLMEIAVEEDLEETLSIGLNEIDALNRVYSDLEKIKNIVK